MEEMIILQPSMVNFLSFGEHQADDCIVLFSDARGDGEDTLAGFHQNVIVRFASP